MPLYPGPYPHFDFGFWRSLGKKWLDLATFIEGRSGGHAQPAVFSILYEFQGREWWCCSRFVDVSRALDLLDYDRYLVLKSL